MSGRGYLSTVNWVLSWLGARLDWSGQLAKSLEAEIDLRVKRQLAAERRFKRAIKFCL